MADLFMADIWNFWPIFLRNLKACIYFFIYLKLFSVNTLFILICILNNPLIAECFFKIGFIERWGTGTQRIIEYCIEEGLPEPLFEIIS